MPIRQQLFSPVNSFIAGRQARQQQDYGESRNALAQMEVENAPREMAYKNALREREIKQFTDQDRQANTEWMAGASQQVLALPPEQQPQAAASMFEEAKRRGIVQPDAQMPPFDPQKLQQFVANSRVQLGQAPEKSAPLSSQGKIAADARSGFITQEQADAALAPKPNTFAIGQANTDRRHQERLAAQAERSRLTRETAQSNQSFARADKLRDEYNTASKEFIGVGDAYQRILSSASDPSAAGDLGLIFSYMKILDPGSVVREQEFANAQNAGGVPDRIRAQYNKVLNGERLSQTQRADFIAQASRIYKGQADRHEKTVKNRYLKMANDLKLDPEYVVSDFGVQEQQVPQQPNQQPTQQQLPPTNAQGWALMVDANGNRAYVSPDGSQVEEVQ